MKNQILLIITIAFGIALLSSCEELDMKESRNLVPLLVTEDPLLPSITVNGTMLHAETFGNPNDSIIIAIHGGPGADYRSILNCQDLAADGYYVVFYDQRGSGLSQRHDADIYNTQIFLDDLDAVVEYYKQTESQKVILFGHSWGAMMAAGYADQHPEKVRGIIMVEPGGFTWDQTMEYINRSQDLNLFGEQMNDFVYLDQFITSDEHNSLDYKKALNYVGDFANGNMVGNSGPFPIWRFGVICNLASIEYVLDNPLDFTENLGSYTTKVLFAYSELNKAYGKEHAEEVSSQFPNVELFEVKGAGHEAVYFGWDKLYPSIQVYLNEIK
jgi:proline iminopeptidase